MLALPIDICLPEIVASLGDASSLVVEAPPGAGKTTRVPAAVLDAGLARGRDVWVLEPRRLAARMAASRVAHERGERLGGAVGYQVRFDETAGPATRLRFVTEGVLTRRLLADPTLSDIGVVVLDEFHERHLQADLALALLKRLQRTARPDLRLVAMSATLDAAPVARYLDDCPVIRSEGRLFDVAVEHLPRPDDRPLAEQVASAVARLVGEGLDGDVLVFLPGAAEIRRARDACAPIASRANLLVLPLHGDLSAAEQDRAVRPADTRKVILSTNVAETSVTIEGVVAVVDSGLARVAGHSPWSGLPTLTVARVSQASASQRAGRAGRLRPGRCIRLYTAQDFAARPAYETPEIERLDLAEPALELHAAGFADLSTFDWFEPPTAEALDAAEGLLGTLGAIDEKGAITTTGRRMLALPLHPRLARIVVEAATRGVALEGCLIAALVGERDIRERNAFSTGRERRTAAHGDSPSDLLDLMDLFRQAQTAGFDANRTKRIGLDPNAVRSVDRVRAHLERIVRREFVVENRSTLTDEQERSVLLAILSGYPDRVARRRTPSQDARRGAESIDLVLANGTAAELSPESTVRQAEFVVAVDADERRDGRSGRRGATLVRLASAIDADALFDLFPEAIAETVESRWNARDERVESVSRLMYGQIALTESRVSADNAQAARLLADAALGAGLDGFVDRDTLDRWLARVAFVARCFPEAGFPELSHDDARRALAAMCAGRASFAEVRNAARSGELLDRMRGALSREQSRLVAAMAPDRVRLAKGREVRVHYEAGKPPWIASRLQDFFGMRESPRIADGRAALVLHLLAPNQRPVQVTSDLAGFWERHYPQIRRELGRRYPRHAWPETPI